MFKVYQEKREQWAYGDFFNIQGPIQYEFPNPRPYLAVSPSLADFEEKKKGDGCE